MKRVTGFARRLAVPTLSVITAFIVGAIVIVLTDFDAYSKLGTDPVGAIGGAIGGVGKAYGSMLAGAFGDPGRVLNALQTGNPKDVATAIRLALEKVSGCEIFFIGAPNTIAPAPTLELVTRRFGKPPEIRRPALYRDDPHAGLFDIAKARRLLGYDPSPDWRRHIGAS